MQRARLSNANANVELNMLAGRVGDDIIWIRNDGRRRGVQTILKSPKKATSSSHNRRVNGPTANANNSPHSKSPRRKTHSPKETSPTCVLESLDFSKEVITATFPNVWLSEDPQLEDGSGSSKTPPSHKSKQRSRHNTSKTLEATPLQLYYQGKPHHDARQPTPPEGMPPLPKGKVGALEKNADSSRNRSPKQLDPRAVYDSLELEFREKFMTKRWPATHQTLFTSRVLERLFPKSGICTSPETSQRCDHASSVQKRFDSGYSRQRSSTKSRRHSLHSGLSSPSNVERTETPVRSNHRSKTGQSLPLPSFSLDEVDTVTTCSNSELPTSTFEDAITPIRNNKRPKAAPSLLLPSCDIGDDGTVQHCGDIELLQPLKTGTGCQRKKSKRRGRNLRQPGSTPTLICEVAPPTANLNM